jgi:hypothetical protein
MITFFRRLALIVAILTLLVDGIAAAADTAARQVQQVTCRVVRIAAGPHGTEAGGEFRLQEERTAFSRLHDTQVTVYFKWEASPGLHHLAATWHSPAGGSSATNAFDHTARDRLFGAYWTIPVSPAMATGKWTIDATVDGLPCGSFSFDIVDADARPAAAARRPLAPAELFDRLQGAFAELERGGAGRLKTDSAAAFLLQPGVLATAFSAIDAADTVHVTFPKGQRREVTSVTAWDRRQDWALLPTASAGTPLPVAGSPASIGDRCYSLEAGPAGTRLLADGTIVGKADAPSGGSRFIVSFTTGEGVPGAPVVNEFGEAIGVIGGGLTPGRTTLGERLRARGELRGAPVVPLSTVAVPASPSPATLQELRQKGITMAPVVAEDSVMQAGFARDIERFPVRPLDQQEGFTAADKRFFVFVSWDPKQRLRGVMKLGVYDEDNRLVVESKPAKADLKPGSTAFSQWQVPVPARPGVYRADVVMGEATLWRGFVTVK